MMSNLQKAGGVAALLMAATFVVAFAVFLGVLMPAGYFDDGITPVEKVRIIVDNAAFVSIGYFIPYVGWSFLQVVLVLALYNRLKARVPMLAQAVAVFGLIWVTLIIASGLIFNLGIRTVVGLSSVDLAQAASVWAAVETIGNALGGEAGEVIGGVWLITLGWAAWRARWFPKLLSYLTLVLGAVAIPTVIPVFQPLAVVFGLGLIMWFIWTGIFLLRDTSRTMPATS